jgi:hypothetical protein
MIFLQGHDMSSGFCDGTPARVSSQLNYRMLGIISFQYTQGGVGMQSDESGETPKVIATRLPGGNSIRRGPHHPIMT